MTSENGSTSIEDTAIELYDINFVYITHHNVNLILRTLDYNIFLTMNFIKNKLQKRKKY